MFKYKNDNLNPKNYNAILNPPAIISYNTPATFSSTLNVSGNTTLNNATTCKSSLNVSGTTTLSSSVNITGATNATYNAPQDNAQGRSLGVFAANLAFSKDVLKDKATIAFNISDILIEILSFIYDPYMRKSNSLIYLLSLHPYDNRPCVDYFMAAKGC